MPIENDILKDINDTCTKLVEDELAFSFLGVKNYEISEGIKRISWINHISGSINTSSYFNSLEQYKTILKQNAYFCILQDGSIIRASYSIKKNELISHNLLYWPSPFDLNLKELDPRFGAPLEILEDIMSSEEWPEKMLMRTPIRIDFDPQNCSEGHPLVHLHIQNKDCRIAVNQPICFNSFVRFIFENHYLKDFKEHDLFKQISPRKLKYTDQKQEHPLFISFKYR